MAIIYVFILFQKFSETHFQKVFQSHTCFNSFVIVVQMCSVVVIPPSFSIILFILLANNKFLLKKNYTLDRSCRISVCGKKKQNDHTSVRINPEAKRSHLSLQRVSSYVIVQRAQNISYFFNKS